jgi:hypothetical protein
MTPAVLAARADIPDTGHVLVLLPMPGRRAGFTD